MFLLQFVAVLKKEPLNDAKILLGWLYSNSPLKVPVLNYKLLPLYFLLCFHVLSGTKPRSLATKNFSDHLCHFSKRFFPGPMKSKFRPHSAAYSCLLYIFGNSGYRPLSHQICVRNRDGEGEGGKHSKNLRSYRSFESDVIKFEVNRTGKNSHQTSPPLQH